MPPSKDPRKAGGSRATKSPERPKTLQSSKKFSSLSSVSPVNSSSERQNEDSLFPIMRIVLLTMAQFQPTLNFSTAPKPGPSTSTVSSKDNDSRSMPPPPAGVKGKGLSHTPLHSTVKRKIEALNENQNAKGKEKAVNGEMSDDEDEDVPQFVGASMRELRGSMPIVIALKGYQDQNLTCGLIVMHLRPRCEIIADSFDIVLIFDGQAALAPGKARIAKVKAWLHEALYGVPENYVAPPGGIDPLAAAKLKKYRVGYPLVVDIFA